MTAARRTESILFFTGATAIVYAVAFIVSGSLPRMEGAGAVAAGVTLDLVVLVPLLWWLLVVRRLGWSWIAVVPAVLASLFAASRIVPAAHHGTLTILELALVPAELVVVGVVAGRAVAAIRRARRPVAGRPDAMAAIRSVTRELVRTPRAAAAVASEVAMFYYACVSWWRPPRLDAASFTTHRRGAYPSVVAGLLLAMAIELVPVHLLLSQWSPLAAWIVTGLGIYGALWLLADLQATRHRPLRLSGDGLQLSAGLRWDLHVALDNVDALEPVRPGADGGKAVLTLSLPGDARYLLTTRQPVVATGMYGIRRTTRTIHFTVDEPERFEREWRRLRSRLEGLATPEDSV